jgi:hypothetical protein
MTFLVQLADVDGGFQFAFKRMCTHEQQEERVFHERVCDQLEVAAYESIRCLAEKGAFAGKVTVIWDGQKIAVKK